jgi:hypothetical protein
MAFALAFGKPGAIQRLDIHMQPALTRTKGDSVNSVAILLTAAALAVSASALAAPCAPSAGSAATTCADTAQAPSVSLSNTWLSLVDQGDYVGSWSATSALFKTRVTEAAWAKVADSARQPFGRAVSRKAESREETTSIPGSPDGRYEVLRFNTVFEHKHDAVETVILTWENEAWKVDGYFVR